MATLFNGVDNVIGMSLGNELRGRRQNITDWYRYMQQGAEAVHSANPDVLVILSGLNYALDLSFLRNRSIKVTFTGKIVFEIHRYKFSEGNKAWENRNSNEVCGKVVDNIMSACGFLLEQGWPLFVSEFGMDLRGTSVTENSYMSCILSVLAELDLEWALWGLQGDYYLRQGTIGQIEYYGVLSENWNDIRNSSFLQRISTLQSPFQGPGLSESKSHKVIFHPLTGLCVLGKSQKEPLRLSPCSESNAWSYTPQKTLSVMNRKHFCLRANGLGTPPELGRFCTNDSSSKWEIISDSKMHLSATVGSGTNACLDVDSNNTIVTNTCKCLSRDNKCDPGSQWFKLVNSTRRLTSA